MSILSESLYLNLKSVCQHLPTFEVAAKRISEGRNFVRESATKIFEQTGGVTDEICEQVDMS